MTLESCINQEYKNIEIIVVDDGSSDKSFEIALEYSKNTLNIFAFTRENAGAPSARIMVFQSPKDFIFSFLMRTIVYHLIKFLHN
ncbi:glycosyltransferase family A protein [Pseudoalteromonas sp. B193]